GPKVDAPDAAIQGFLRSTGLTKDQLKIQKDPKGDFYLAVTERKGRPTPVVIAEIVPEIIRTFPWPKQQRWGAGDLTWVRPLHAIVCTFDGEIVPFEIGGIKSGNKTRGHRFLGNEQFEVRRFDDYVEKLKRAHAILDAAERKATILHEAKQLAHAQNLELIADETLADEVAGLVEWPVALIGQFDKAFLDVPQEILISTMRANQKYFALKDPKTGKLANKFVVISNMITKDGGKNIVAGNERVLRARLSDAKFFWDQDKKIRLEARVPQLKDIVFHAKLGTQYERVERMRALTKDLIDRIQPGESESAQQAASLCKADLVSGTVGEFPEVQGLIGGYLALSEGLSHTVADAIRDHYKPQGPADSLPSSAVGASVALAEKLDTLVGMFGADEKPTGSKDPYALRRAALGVVRIVIERQLRLPLTQVISGALQLHRNQRGQSFGAQTTEALLGFFADRLKVALRDKGTRHDLVDAVFSLGNQDDLVLIVRRVEALQSFLSTDDGKNLLAGYKRALNILKIEEAKEKKKDAKHAGFSGKPDVSLLQVPQEVELFKSLAIANDLIAAEVQQERFEEAMRAMSRLRAPVDAFFEKVTVNDADPTLRDNRLKLLSEIRQAMHTVADFSKIEG
ncbi:MAG: glycine--tRNA ligase subunit beta, partial [Micropepsaceae bacterium]